VKRTDLHEFTAEQFEQRLAELVLKYYNAAPPEEGAAENDPNRLFDSLVKGTAELMEQNNKSLKAYIRQVSYGAGGRKY